MKLYIALFLLFQQFVFAQLKEVEATLTVDKSYSYLSDPIKVEFELNDTSTHFEPPSFKSFTILSGPNSTYSTTFNSNTVNEVSSQKSKITYIIKPLSLGELIIEEGSFNVNGKIYKTPIKSISIQENKTTNSDFYKGKIFLVCEISNTNPFRNQPTTVTYRVYYDKGLKAPSGVRLIFDSEYQNDFLVGNTSRLDEGVSLQKFNGIEYYSFIIQTDFLRFKDLYDTYVKGMLEIDFDQILYTIGDDSFKKTTTKKIPFESNRIITKNLPLQYNHFRADAVGEFSFEPNTIKKVAQLNSEFNFELIIKGKGIIENDPKTLPILSLPPQLHLVKTEVDNELYYEDNTMTSVNTIKYTIMPLEKGIYTIKKPLLRYFNNSNNKYEETYDNEFVITVK
jgi:hypothetical protein